MSTARYSRAMAAARAQMHAESRVEVPSPPMTAALDGRRQRGRHTRDRILAAATELFAANGFDATSTQAVAAAANITVAAIYRHFPSKVDLLVAVARRALETTFGETISDTPPSSAEQIADIVLAYATPERAFTRRVVIELIHAAAQHPDVAAALHTFHQRAREHIADALRAGQRDGSIAADLDPALAARDILLLIMGICNIDTLDPEALADERWRLSLRRTVHATVGSGAGKRRRR